MKPLGSDYKKLIGIPLFAYQVLGTKSRADVGRKDRWNRVALAALKQCLRIHQLKVESPVAVDQLLQTVNSYDKALLATAGGEPVVDELQGLMSGGHLTE